MSAGRNTMQGRLLEISRMLGSGAERDARLQLETRSLLAVPIRYESQVLGVMEADNEHDNAHYTADDVTILEIISNYVGIALFNAALLREEITEEPHSRQLDVILRSATRLQKILDDMASVESHHSRDGKMHWRVVDLGESHQTVYRSFQDEASKKKIARVMHSAGIAT